MKLNLLCSALSFASAVALSPRGALIGLAVGVGIVACVWCVLGVVTFVRRVNERE